MVYVNKMEKAKTNGVNDETLLRCIFNYKPLFDKKCKGYKSVLQKETCWQAVARRLRIPKTTAKARFKSLREKFRRETILTRSGAGSNNRPQWALLSIFKCMMDDADYKSSAANIKKEYGDQTDATSPDIARQLSPCILQIDSDNYNGDLFDSSYVVNGDEKLSIMSSSLSCTPFSSATGEFCHLKEEQLKTQSPSVAVIMSSTLPPEHSGGSTVTVAKKRKCLITPTTDEREMDEQDVSEITNKNVKKQQNSDNKFEKFAAYLIAELEDFPLKHANIFMDSITESLIEYKRKLRDADA